SLVLPTETGELPLRRVFQDAQGNTIQAHVIPQYGYDVRKRDWYRQTKQADQATVSQPYLSYSLGSPVITLGTPLRGTAPGVIATDLKLDTFSDLVYAQRPGEHGRAIIFDATGALIANRQYRQLSTEHQQVPGQASLPNIHDDNSSPVAEIIRGWNRGD